VKSVGFVTRDFPQSTVFWEEGSVLVFVPTTPNPTSGFLVAVPQEDVTTLPISVEQGVKLVISGGLLTPDILVGGDARLLDGDTVEHDTERRAGGSGPRPDGGRMQ
jgi:uncharacterized membrane protein